jgi:hypothetical protein
MMMNWKGFGRKRLWPNFKVVPGIRLDELRKKQDKPQSGSCWAEILTRDLPNKERVLITLSGRSIGF